MPERLPVDPDKLSEIRSLQLEDAPDLLAEVIGLFLEDTPHRIRRIEAALAAANAAALIAPAHALKGSAGNIGASRMASYCGELIELGREGELEGAAALFGDLTAEFERVRVQLEAELDGAVQQSRL